MPLNTFASLHPEYRYAHRQFVLYHPHTSKPLTRDEFISVAKENKLREKLKASGFSDSTIDDEKLIKRTSYFPEVIYHCDFVPKERLTILNLQF